MPTLSSLTVAEQVAALPPLSQLLGIDPPGAANHKTKDTGKAPAWQVSTRTGASCATKASSSHTRSAVTPRRPPLDAPPGAAPTINSLATAANLEAPLCSSSARKEEELQAAPSTLLTDECIGGLREWRRVRQSLQLPIAYRAEEDVHLSLRLLRSLALFAPLLDDDLLTLAETMEVMEVTGAGKVLLRKCAAGHAARLPSRTGAAAEAMVKTPADRPPLSLDALLTPPLLDDEEEQERPQGVWTMPAAQLFQCFREQMGRGEPPSLPSERTENVVGLHMDDALPPITVKATTRRSAQRSQGQSTVGLTRVPATGITTAPLFFPDDDTLNGDGAFALVLLSGHCHLEWPRERGLMEDSTQTPLWQSYELQPGDAMGYALIWGALPPWAQYVTSETITLLIVSSEGRPPEVAARLRRVCRRANEAVLRAQRRFLAHELRVPLFNPDDSAMGMTRATVTDVGEAQEEQGPQGHAAATVAEAAVPSIASLLDTTARNLIPIRIPTHTVLFREGLTPVKECAIYFILDGGLAVVRRIWSQDQQRLFSEQMQLVRALTPATGICPPLSPLPATDSMEVAQLRRGDYCGDLAYLNEDPDHVASMDAEWTAAYWQSTLAQPTARSSQDGRRRDTDGQCSRDVTDHASGRGANSSLFRRHKATVVAQQASSLYVLLPRAADEALVGVVEQRMRDHVHREYAGYRHVFAEYEKLYKWALYKERVLYDVSQKAPVNFR
ncbi:hypothetical protein - conserved [Leishmania donovani]|uniref:Uncharacterized protein n=4 Tax=Leishmania donovani species complex TaxID=38574 RepID=A4HZR8_LEIIN|nr:conserved hypothetical protein [Leishmania infantum JPCM5]CAC9487668.1 hypothetical_protein_-_conserved [Leishmania infantum]CAJ1988737.1 hypothetical protein - conserved [Leishmania donovani]CAM67982.1 conserved hypothetical protein [Leishmania infantum JPCM5]SUZ41730.1 hypothetical_protein_-_conserved [Leishmania infantum]VDZ44617.1 hypothetical_protein_conserved [Leishmania donovani]|eukprot:XP_001465559.1 conserved hypothetical protein [Leishmania infantum JPCM5]